MRAAEYIHIVVFGFFIALAWQRKLPPARRAKVTVIGILGLSVTLAGVVVLPGRLPVLAVSVVRDWLPSSLVLLVYWQAGAFFLRVDQGFQDRLEGIDERLLPAVLNGLSASRAGKWILVWLEACYLLCYPMVPLSLGTLYLLRLGRYADHFWAVVLVSTYLSYGMLPFLQTLPPRMLPEPWLHPITPNPVRRLNLWLLRHASIHANTFPSAHVASSTGAALMLNSLAPWPVGVLFVVIATGIAIGTFAGRYHFATDALTGSALAMLVFLLATYLWK